MRPATAVLTFIAATAAFPSPAQNVVDIAPPPPPVTVAPDEGAPNEAPDPSSAVSNETAPDPEQDEAPATQPRMTTEVLPVSPDAPYPEGFADPVDSFAEDMEYQETGGDFDWGLLGLIGLIGLLGLRRRR